MIALLLAASLPPGPVDFKATEMRMEPRERRVLLDGDVHLVRGDLAVSGQHALVDYAEKAPAPASKKQKKASLGGEDVRRFVVDGGVHVQRGDRTADGAHGEIDFEKQTVVLTGTDDAPPVVREKSETLSGETITLRLDSEDVLVSKPRLVLKRSMQPAQPSGPVRVEAAKLVLHKDQKLARFSDNVVVHRGDATVRSPRMDARYDASGQVTRLELRGGVDLRQGERRATGESADYDAQTREVALTGDPKLYDRGDVLSGERIDVSLDSKEVRVEKARGRLRPEAHKEEK